MATLTHYYKPNPIRIILNRTRDDLTEKVLPRRRAVLPAGLVLAGLGIEALMFFGLLPLSLLLAFAGLALTGVGGVLALVLCGEI